MWYRDTGSESFAIVSDTLDHSKNTVFPFTFKLLQSINTLFGLNIKTIDIWTDGPTSQFKNQYLFHIVGKIFPDLFRHWKINWNYFATSHGKGAVDGIGGSIKRLAERIVKSRLCIIKDAESFADNVEPHTKTVIIHVIPNNINKILAEHGYAHIFC